jgi:hypothetical protein
VYIPALKPGVLIVKYQIHLCPFLALDMCFRLKRRLVSSELKDPGLGARMAYLLENAEFRDYLLTVTDQVEVSATQ